MIELSNLRPNGIFLRREALDLGYRDRDLARARRDQVIHRVRHGTYVDASTWASARPEERHRLMTESALLTHRPGAVAVSHTSAAVMHGLSLYRPDLAKVHLTLLDGTAGRTTQDVVYHEGRVTDHDLVEREGVLLIEPVRAALETATLMPIEPGLVVLDSLLVLEHTDLAGLWARYHRMKSWPRTRGLQVVVRLARPGAMSAGETRIRHLCWWAHVPEPVLQFEVRDRGKLVGISDFWWPEADLLGEFDGLVKYGRWLKPGETPAEAVFREKQREDRLRELTGARMIRFTWADCDSKHETARRLRAALRLDAA